MADEEMLLRLQQVRAEAARERARSAELRCAARLRAATTKLHCEELMRAMIQARIVRGDTPWPLRPASPQDRSVRSGISISTTPELLELLGDRPSDALTNGPIRI